MFDHWQLQDGPLYLRGQSEKLIAPEKAAKLRNLTLTKRGTLRTVRGPAQYHPRNWVGDTTNDINYAFPMDGVFHCTLREGSRDILLYVGTLTTDGGSPIYGVWEHWGWQLTWNLLVGDDSSADYRAKLIPGDKPQFLTQFVATPTGVIILHQGHRPLFYDGDIVAPLGYTERPSPPEPRGPRMTYEDEGGSFADSMTGGYYKTARVMNRAFGFCRLGVLEFPQALQESGVSAARVNELGGSMRAGERRARVQWLDHWGNLSPASLPSAPLTWAKEDNITKDRKRLEPEDARAMKPQGAWEGVSPGPPGTVGRIVGLTRDLKSSGDSTFYEAPNYAAEGILSFATMPGNTGDLLPDNIPDSWLISPMDVGVVPMESFRLATLAFGRVWFANAAGSPGLLRPSDIGRWGTTRRDHDIYPDPSAGEITGLHAVQGGLLVFTKTSTFLVTANDAGDSFRAATVHPTVGCVSPDSIATLPNGLTIWLSREGFHAYNGDTIEDISGDIKVTVNQISPTWRLRSCAAVDPHMGEYRCWVPIGAGIVEHPSGALVEVKNASGLCLVTADGENWTERLDSVAAGVCVTKDERELMIVAGKAPCQSDLDDDDVYVPALLDSVWVLDHEQHGLQKSLQHQALIETHWLRVERSHRRGSPVKLTLWFLETQKTNMTIEVMRDYRTTPSIHTISTGENAPMLYPDDDIPLFYDVDEINGSRVDPQTPRDPAVDHAFRTRRPYWSRADLLIPSCEVFRVRITVTGDAEFVALSFGENPAHAGGAKTPKGVR